MRTAMCLLLLAACGEDPDAGDPGEVITTVMLEVTPPGGTTTTFTFDDPDGDGGSPPTADMVTLTAGTTYMLAVRFQNRLETPPEEITDEVRDEGAQHQVFFTGTAVNGPATNNPSAPLTHTYGDQDANQLPIGLSNTIAAAAGAGDLTVTLRHLPPVNDTAVKTANLAGQVKTSGISSIPGESDAAVTFAVTVQ